MTHQAPKAETTQEIVAEIHRNLKTARENLMETRLILARIPRRAQREGKK